MFPSFDSYIQKKHDLEQKLSVGEWSDRQEFIQTTKEYSQVNSLLELKENYDKDYNALEENRELQSQSQEDEEMLEMLLQEEKELESKVDELTKKLMIKLLPPDENCGRNLIVEIRAGTGGEEASLFAGELYRSYQRYCETLGLGFEPLEMNGTGLGGIKEVTFSIKGDEAWTQFKYESGTHRVQRVPVTETSGRIHTSAVTVAVLPEAEDVDIDINPEEIRVDTYRSSGPGGQSVNTTDSAIRITHLPTGLVVTCQDEKSQHKNKAKAMRILRARLLELRQHEENSKRANDRRSQIGSGDRSEKIRTYNFPQNRVTDHRINLTLYNLQDIMNGKLDTVSYALGEAEYKLLVEQAS